MKPVHWLQSAQYCTNRGRRLPFSKVTSGSVQWCGNVVRDRQTDRHTDGCGHYTFRLGYASRRNGYGLSYCLYRPDALPAAKPTVSKHCRQNVISNFLFICSSNSVSETIVVNNLIWWLTWLWCDDWRGSDVMVHVTLMWWLTWLWCGWCGSDVTVDMTLMWWLTWL